MKTLYGLLGEHLGHSISPLIHSITLRKLGINGYYHLFEVERSKLKLSLEGLNCIGAKGVNVTIPYKTDIMGHLDFISTEASRIGSINTVAFTDDGTIGYNTDYFGLKRTFDRNGIDIKDKKAVILGSGGVAITTVQLLLDQGAKEITIVGRSVEKVQAVDKFKELNICTFHNIENIVNNDILINCTPSGMYPNINECLVPNDILSSFESVVDLIYNPKETLLLQNAKVLGLKAVNGLYMLVSQAVEAQGIWNEVSITYEFIDEIFDEVEANCGWL